MIQRGGGTGFQPVVTDEFKLTRRNLPHWQVGGSTYFITFRTRGLELPPQARQLVLDACRHFDGVRYDLWAVVIMPDHAHTLIRPIQRAPGQWWSLASILHSIKSFTANAVNRSIDRRGPLWQDESLDRIVRDEKEFIEKWNYIRTNPVRRGLCETPEQWDASYESGGTGL